MTIALLIITCFIDSLAAMIILTHALQSIGDKLEIDPIHFAIIVLVSIIFGGITPPVAPLTYIASGIADADPTESIIATLPFIVIAFITIAIIIIFPETCLFLPNLFMK
jgi:C4-dicarboxylate transporter DctM subunit